MLNHTRGKPESVTTKTPTKGGGNEVQLMHENYDIASECGIVRGWTMRGAKLREEGPVKSLRKQESEARKQQKTQSITKSGG